MKLSHINFSFFLICTTVLVHTCTSSPATAVVPDELSVVTRYGGMGYNALQANPEGEFSQAAINPGIKLTRFIFNHTYCEGKRVYYRGQSMQVPDQIVFQPRVSCASAESVNAYSGQTSYQNQLSVNVDISGMIINSNRTARRLYSLVHACSIHNNNYIYA